MRSLYVRIAKKDRKFIKGARLMANNLDSILTESGASSQQQQQQMQTMEDEEESSTVADHELDIYLMSRAHLSLNHELLTAKSNLNHNRLSSSRKRLRFAGNYSSSSSPASVARHCVCEKLRKTSRRINTKYLLLANVLRTRALVEGDSLGASADLKHRRYKYRRDKLTRHSPNRFKNKLKINLLFKQKKERRIWSMFIFSKHLNRFSLRDGWKRGVPSSSSSGVGGQRQIKLIYLNAMFPWNRARAFIEYLENDSIDKRDMCKNVKRSVSEIYRARDMLF